VEVVGRAFSAVVDYPIGSHQVGMIAMSLVERAERAVVSVPFGYSTGSLEAERFG
jgi:hypothetical protein